VASRRSHGDIREDYVGDAICSSLCLRRAMLRTFTVVEMRPLLKRPRKHGRRIPAFDEFISSELPAGRAQEHAGKLEHSWS
jgi:hypothetical protein